MGRRGPLPKPTAIRELEGDPGKLLSKRGNEPKPRKVERVRPPAWLGQLARNEWRRIAPELERLGLLTVLDISTLQIYCDLYLRWREAQKAGDVKQLLELANRLKQYIAEFGLSPAARVRIDADEPAAPPATKPSTEGNVVNAARFFERA